MKASAGKLLAAVALLHVGGFALGYTLSRVVKLPGKRSRTVSIEVGMQNSVLGTVLANVHFSTLAATPCAISAVYHCLIGSFLASIWRARTPVESAEEGDSEESPPAGTP